LIGGLEHGFYFSIQLGMSSSQLTSIFFKGVGQPPTRLVYPLKAWKQNKPWSMIALLLVFLLETLESFPFVLNRSKGRP
jgi:hypothetical protein